MIRIWGLMFSLASQLKRGVGSELFRGNMIDMWLPLRRLTAFLRGLLISSDIRGICYTLRLWALLWLYDSLSHGQNGGQEVSLMIQDKRCQHVSSAEWVPLKRDTFRACCFGQNDTFSKSLVVLIFCIRNFPVTKSLPPLFRSGRRNYTFAQSLSGVSIERGRQHKGLIVWGMNQSVRPVQCTYTWHTFLTAVVHSLPTVALSACRLQHLALPFLTSHAHPTVFPLTVSPYSDKYHV